MRRRSALVLVLTAALTQSSCLMMVPGLLAGRTMGGGGMGMMGMMGGMGNGMNHSQTAPAPYDKMLNPVPHSAAAVAQGAQIFQAQCATCHGPKGLGDGLAGLRLSPRPANLSQVVKSAHAKDGHLMWVISEGGRMPGSAMPPFKASIGEEDRWRLIHYLRTL
ncbi:MAG: cytochrome c [Gammaproteobacteria bacterium]|nr:cytochrome c [Gammaproteobacteria bacterium]MBU1653610.1 cytochrome c [Gammaproteobacteria bacterium]MBU1960975.1 cytochrome c [Gammaproteobacteria bacterium]